MMSSWMGSAIFPQQVAQQLVLGMGITALRRECRTLDVLAQ